MMAEVSFKVTREEARLISKIAGRAVRLAMENGVIEDKETLEMDVTAVHANGCPLDLEKLMGFDDFNLAHDVFGIHQHIDRTTGELTDCFLPRCAKPE